MDDFPEFITLSQLIGMLSDFRNNMLDDYHFSIFKYSLPNLQKFSHTTIWASRVLVSYSVICFRHRARPDFPDFDTLPVIHFWQKIGIRNILTLEGNVVTIPSVSQDIMH